LVPSSPPTSPHPGNAGTDISLSPGGS
jgi:hypothetical protein